MNKSLFKILSVGILILFTPLWAEAAEIKPHIDDLRLSQGETSVLLSAHLMTGFKEEMHKALQGGIPLTFSYRIHLTRKGSILGEKIVRRREIIHNLEFDPVKQVYMFKAEGYRRGNVTRTTRDETEALKWLTNIQDWPLYPLQRLEINVRYRVRVMATLKSVELPSVLGYLFFFTNIFNQETPWVQVDFTF